MIVTYSEQIKLLTENNVDDKVIDMFREMHYDYYKSLDIEQQVKYINSLLRDGATLVYIAEILFGVDESTIRKHLNNNGYTRMLQFTK